MHARLEPAFARLAARLDRALARLLAALLAAIVLAVSWQVVSRYLLADPSGWTEELARFLLIWIGLFGGALAFHRRLHLGLDLLPRYLRARDAALPAGRPARAGRSRLFGRIADACVLVFALTVLVGGGSALVALTFGLRQVSPALGLPMGAVYLGLPLAGLAMTLSAIAAIVDPDAARRSTD